MKKKTLKAFTLVEILIVIVIIGILIWALVPRMSAAQGRARDVARKNDLAQLQSAIVTSQQDKGLWPWMSSANSWAAIEWINISSIKLLLETAGMNSVPSDPLQSNLVKWLWKTDGTNLSGWQYGYMVSKRNGTANAWFILMAKTEVEWWSNRVVCSWASNVESWFIKTWEDLWKLTLCTSVNKKTTNGSWCWIYSWSCIYELDGELRYVLLY